MCGWLLFTCIRHCAIRARVILRNVNLYYIDCSRLNRDSPFIPSRHSSKLPIAPYLGSRLGEDTVLAWAMTVMEYLSNNSPYFINLPSQLRWLVFF
jgi:hypothetical protein